MLAVAEIDYIRLEANHKGCSYSDIARRMNLDPRTVKKYAEMEDFNPSKRKQKRKARVMDPVKPILDQWIKEDLKKKKKYRRTAKRMYEMLKEQYDFKGSDRSVRLYVSKRKKELMAENESAALPLEGRPATAQVDFGEAPFIYKGEHVNLPFLVLSFPNSNGAYVQVLPSQNRECFLEGLKRMFHYMGQVPRVIRFDNLSPAVKRILPNGERELTEDFQRFVLHYGFKCEFCNPASGNEKGNVEAKVKYIRNNFFLPEQTVNDLDSFNDSLWEKCEKDFQRPHYQKGKTIAELFEEEKEFFLQLPAKEFECVRYEQLKADKYGFIRIDNKLYSTSPRFAKQMVLAKISYKEIEILTENYESIIKHERLYGKKQKSMKWQPYLTLMAKRPNALKYDKMANEWKNYFSNCTIQEKKEALQLLSVLLKEHNFEISTQALRLATQRGHPDIESIKHIFYQLINGRGIRDPIKPKIRVPNMPNTSRGVNHYDRLFQSTGGEV
ncbi:integrase [Compostibacillus humi]|uniref:Integrase n=1 Tax=Compostibacillus humi TaxID=1245525 RepID=A0A8J2X9J7_9BACI|nr:IS21 family transposase [Compostibacillus humi]GFZ82048.1 integrase [Compostibacillus humi]